MKIPLSKLEPWSPLMRHCWIGLDSPVTREEIRLAVSTDDLRCEPVPVYDWSKPPIPRIEHVRRVAYFVVYATQEPIELDVGVPELGWYPSWIIEDGNHRLAAAFFRGDKEINASVSGSIAHAKELLGIEISC